MKMSLTRAGWRTRLSLAVALGTLLLLAIGTPLFGPGVQAVLMAAFSPLCHQLPDRSLWIAGGQVALCHRCTGIALGIVLGMLVAPLRGTTMSGGWVLVVAFAPIALDWGLAAFGLWDNSLLTRAATGLWAGLLLGGLIARAAAVNPEYEEFVAAE